MGKGGEGWGGHKQVEERKPDGVLQVEGRERQHEKENRMESKGKWELELNGVRLWSTREAKQARSLQTQLQPPAKPLTVVPPRQNGITMCGKLLMIE